MNMRCSSQSAVRLSLKRRSFALAIKLQGMVSQLAANSASDALEVEFKSKLENLSAKRSSMIIDLASFGVDMTNVNSISLGVGTKNAPAPGGGTGKMYFDEIVLIK